MSYYYPQPGYFCTDPPQAPYIDECPRYQVKTRVIELYGAPYGIRTRITALRGRRPNH